MTIEQDNATLAINLCAAYMKERNERRNIALPSAIRFTINEKTARMHLGPSSVKANMQDNQASFEGWALALKRWLPNDFSKVELSWEFTEDASDPHYQRFLYRVKRFKSLFTEWFSVVPLNLPEINKLKTEEGGHKFLLNVASMPRSSKLDEQCNSLDKAMGSEHKLECFIVGHQEELCRLLAIDKIDRQLPVGVFRDCVSSKAEHGVFTRGHSAIDLWGVSKNGKKLFLFELKKEGNERLGILSEMFFYSYVMADVQLKRFEFNKPNEEIEQTKTIETYILAPDWHPLIDEKMLQIINEAFERHEPRIRFGAIRLVNTPEIYTITLNAQQQKEKQ
jgi:hypothetical protein